MKTNLKFVFQKLVNADTGATLVEYGIAITLVVAVGVGGLTALGGAVSGNINEATDTFE